MRRSAALTPAWEEALEGFVAANPTEGAAARARLTRVRRLAEDLSGDPVDVTPADIAAWVDGLGASPDAARKYRQAARSFYRWAVEAGVVDANPVTAPPLRQYTADAQWADAAEQFRKAQVGAQLAADTVEVRLGHVQRFGREVGREPWKVTHADYSAWIAGLSVASNTRAKMRDSLRAFYRWAHKRGRIDEDPTAEPSRRASTPAVPDAWEREIRSWRSWLRGAGHPETTVRLRVTQLRALARDHASLSPWDVTLDDLIEWLAGKRWNGETRKSHRSALRSFYRWALETDRVDQDPADRLPAIRLGRPQPRPAHEDDYARALRMAEGGDRLALRLAAELGMRCAEVAQVHVRDLAHVPVGRDADGAPVMGWTLLVHGKGSKQRTLPVPEALAHLVRSHDGYVFPGDYDGHVSPTWLSARISRLLPTGVTMHALRHRFATRAYNVSRDVFTVQALLGHSSPATTQRYVLVNDDSKRDLVEAIAAMG